MSTPRRESVCYWVYVMMWRVSVGDCCCCCNDTHYSVMAVARYHRLVSCYFVNVFVYVCCIALMFWRTKIVEMAAQAVVCRDENGICPLLYCKCNYVSNTSTPSRYKLRTLLNNKKRFNQRWYSFNLPIVATCFNPYQVYLPSQIGTVREGVQSWHAKNTWSFAIRQLFCLIAAPFRPVDKSTCQRLYLNCILNIHSI